MSHWITLIYFSMLLYGLGSSIKFFHSAPISIISLVGTESSRDCKSSVSINTLEAGSARRMQKCG